MIYKKKYSILSNLIKMQIFAILFSFAFLIIFFVFIRKSVVGAELNKTIVKVKNSLNEDQEQLRAWAYMDMNEAVEQTLLEIKNRYKFEEIELGPRKELSQFITENSFVLPEKSDNILGEDLVLFVKLKKANDSFWDHFDRYSFWFLFVLAISFALILLFSAEYIRRNIFFPFRDLVEQLEEIDSSKNSYLSAIPAKGEVGIFIDKVTQIYNSSKIKEKEEARFKLAKQVAHDIKSPLLALDVAMENIGSVDDTSRLLINDAVTRIKDIANNLLSVKGERRLRSDKLLLEVELERAISEKRILFKGENSIQFKLDYDIPLGAVAFIEMNASKLQRSISNLINNAVEAMNGSGEIGLYFSFIKADRIRLKISDTGSGIPQNKLQLIQQQGYSFNKKGGHGLGLSYAIDAFQEAGAKVAIQSIEGMGTDIIIDIPSAKPPSYFYHELVLNSQSQCVFVDDYENILRTWKDVIGKNFPEAVLKNCIFMNDLEEFQNWLDLKKWDENTLFFVDYHFTRDQIKGTDIIASYPIKQNTVLVTSQYDNPKLIKKIKELKIKLLPKQLQKKLSCKYIETSINADHLKSGESKTDRTEAQLTFQEKNLNSNFDLEALKKYIDQRLLTGKENVLEIGLEPTSPLDWLCGNYPNPICGIDSCSAFYEKAKRKYLESHQVEFYLTNVEEFDFSKKDFDLVLWSWGDLKASESTKCLLALNQLKKIMKKNACIILALNLTAEQARGLESLDSDPKLSFSEQEEMLNSLESLSGLEKALKIYGFRLEDRVVFESEQKKKKVNLIFNYSNFLEGKDERKKDLSASIC